MWGRCQGAAYSVSIFGTSEGGGWINGTSVGLDPEKRILGSPSTWLMKRSVCMESSTLKLGGRVLEVPCRAHEVKKPIFGTVWGWGG